MLKALYDADVAEEDIILAWHDKQDAAKVGVTEWVGAALSGSVGRTLSVVAPCRSVVPAMLVRCLLGLCCCCEQGQLLTVGGCLGCCCYHCRRCWACLRMLLLRCASLCRPSLTGWRRRPVRRRVRRRTAMSERAVWAASATLLWETAICVLSCRC